MESRSDDRSEEDVNGVDEEDGDESVTEAEEKVKAKTMTEGDGGSRSKTRVVNAART